jgi:hypothetical protein
MITRQQIIADEAIKAPYDLSEGFVLAAQNAEKLISQMKVMGTSAGSPSKLAKETNELTAAQVELEKIQKQLVVAQAKQNDEVIKLQKELIKERDAIKQKTALGEKDAKSVKAQTASIQELQAALNANRKAYASLRSEEERNSKTGKELLAIIEEQDKGVKELKATMGQHQDKVGEYEGAMKSLKVEFKLARDQMASLATTLGTQSPEFIAAAQRAGELKDQINDIGDAVKNTEASGIENVAQSFGSVVDKLKSGDISGAADSAKQFATNLRSVSFAELSKGVGSFGSAMASVGRALLTNPIFLIAAAVTAAVVAFTYFSNQAEKATQRMLDRSQREIDKITERYDHEIRLMEIAGKKTFDLERAKQRLIISTADQAMKSAGDVTEVDLLQSIFQRQLVRKVSEEKLGQLKEFQDAKKDAQKELEIIDAEEAAFTQKAAEETTKKITEEIDKRLEAQIQADIKLGEQRNLAEAERKAELDRTLADLETRKSVEEEISTYIRDIENADHEEWLRKRDERKTKLQEEIATQQQIVNEMVAIVQNAAVSNDNFIKALTKQGFIFFLNQIERTLLAAQAETIAKATAQALATPDSVLSFGATGITRALVISGLIKAGFAVARNQIARFEVGTDSAPGGLAWVGEGGRELIQTPSGRLSLTPDSATLVDLPKGSRVFTNDETMQMLAMSGIGQTEFSKGINMSQLIASMEKSNKANADRIVSATSKRENFTKKGSILYKTIEDEQRNRKLIRQSVTR